ncbi:unnamed protein product [Lactuca saligna]|uniref:Uncharacterized protein n=1 Tax=Lactuca saligna TaxID=75948 RepID=A0AA35YTT4_LACSI|nr:unnamed protein product [Lactuca saligna]
MGRTPCCEKNGGIRKGPWTTEEDQKLIDYIHKNGYRNWRTLPKNAGLQRCGKSCRLRWTNYLKPDIKRGKFSSEEEETIIKLHSILGNKWSTIAAHLPGRTDNEIKNFWNTHIRKRLLRMGIDPITHTTRLDILALSSILNSSIYNSPQMNLLRIQPMVNPEFMRLAASHLSSQGNQNPNFIHQKDQLQLENTLQVRENHHLLQDQTLIQEMSDCASLSTPTCVVTSSCETSKLIQPNVNEFPSSISDFKPQTFPYIDILTCNNLESFVTLYDNYGYHINPQSMSATNSASRQSFANSSIASPSSTLVNSISNSTYIDGSTREEGREIRNCNNLFKSESQELLNPNYVSDDYMLVQINNNLKGF